MAHSERPQCQGVSDEIAELLIEHRAKYRVVLRQLADQPRTRESQAKLNDTEMRLKWVNHFYRAAKADGDAEYFHRALMLVEVFQLDLGQLVTVLASLRYP